MSETNRPETVARRKRLGIFERFINGKGIDIGCGISPPYSYEESLTLIQPDAVAHDSHICDAHHMNVYQDEEFEYVYSSHVLEHLWDPVTALKNWYRICKTGGYMVLTVPAKYRYEKKNNLPSKWNEDHKRFYTISLLASEIEQALEPNSYLIEHLQDCADGFDWSIPPSQHSSGEYQIECVIKKISKPGWSLE